MFNCHHHMQPFLADLQDRAGLPITYSRWRPRYMSAPQHRHEIELFGPQVGSPTTFALPHAGQVHELQVVSTIPTDGEPIELTHNDNIYRVATVVGRRVLLAFDLEHLFEAPGDLAPGQVLEAVLAPAILLAAKNVREYAWHDETETFVHWNVAGVDQQIACWRNNVRDNEYELDRLCAMSASLARKNTELREHMQAASRLTREDRQTKARSEFAALTKMVPKVIDGVRIEHGKLFVTLPRMTLEHDGCEYEMGGYTLTIDADKVRIHSDAGHHYPHPHVSSDGVPCWGNLGSVIAKALGEREYVGLVAAIVEFLKSYNERDAYRNIQYWDPDHESDDD